MTSQGPANEPTGTPLPTDAALTRANLLRMRRSWSEATDICVDLLKSHPGSGEAYSLLGDISRDQGLTDDAARWYGMAIELRPNASDERKLRDIRAAQSAPKSLSAVLRKQPIEAAEGEPNNGTVSLMGVSPRRWLRVITFASVLFLAVMLIGLLRLQALRKRESPVPRPMPAGLISTPAQPTTQDGPATQPEAPGASPPGSSEAGGSGLPPDRAPIPSGPSAASGQGQPN